MGGCVLVLLAFAIIAMVVAQRRRIRDLEFKVASLENSVSGSDALETSLRELAKRLGTLETQVAPRAEPQRLPTAAPPTAASAAAAVPVVEARPRPAEPLPTVTSPASPRPPQDAAREAILVEPPAGTVPRPLAAEPVRAVPALAGTSAGSADRLLPGPMAARVEPPLDVGPPLVEAEPEPEVSTPAWGEQIRAGLAGDEWEAIVGGSWLNKIGVAVLVIGVALLLGYSFARMGPAGRVALGLAISLAMLGPGVWTERRERYVVFARGLIGGGWAALYFTTYAMHGLDAARVIDSSLLGTALLVAVAAGMIGHSLRYRSQVVTALAYFLAFAALSLGGAPGFSLVAIVPLAVSLLLVTRWFSWAPMSLAGLVMTYGTYLIAASGSPNPTLADFIRAESVLAVYWLLFEAFDLIEFARGRSAPLTAAIFGLNACAFIGISLLQWTSMTPQTVYLLFGATGVIYIASAMMRARIRPPSTFESDTSVVERMVAGGYEGAVTLAAGLIAWGLSKRFDGLHLTLALGVEAQMLFLVGRVAGQWYVRLIGTVLMAVPAARMGMAVASMDATMTAVGLTLRAWMPMATLMSAVFYVNRALLRGMEPLPAERLYNAAASVLAVTIVGYLMPRPWLGIAWAALAFIFFEIGARTRAGEFRFHGYVTAALALGTVLSTNVVPVSTRHWLVPALAGALSFALALRQVYGRNVAPDEEKQAVRFAMTVPGTALAAIVCWLVVPDPYFRLAWLLVAAALFEIGVNTSWDELKDESYVLGAVSVFSIALIDAFGTSGHTPSAQITLGGASLVLVERYLQMTFRRPRRLVDAAAEVARTRHACSAAAMVFLATLVWYMAPVPVVAIGWAAIGLLAIESGYAVADPALRTQGHALMAAAIGRLFFANFTTIGATAGVSHRLMTIAPFVLLLYYLASRIRQSGAALTRLEQTLARWYVWAPAVLAVLVVRFELGRTLTVVGWMAIAVAFLVIGTRRRDDDVRLQSYLLAIATFIRSWTTNFNAPESLSGWAEPAVFGSVVIALFFISQLLTPRPGTAQPARSAGLAWLDDHARMGFGLLGTILLTVLLYHETSARVLTMAWGIEAAAVLVLGFVAHERALRLSGLLLLAVCILKLFVVDFRSLDALSRIVSFIVLGLLLVAASWVYTRYREQLHRYL